MLCSIHPHYYESVLEELENSFEGKDLRQTVEYLLPLKKPRHCDFPLSIIQELPSDHGGAGSWGAEQIEYYKDRVLDGAYDLIWKSTDKAKHDIQLLKSREYLRWCAAKLFGFQGKFHA